MMRRALGLLVMTAALMMGQDPTPAAPAQRPEFPANTPVKVIPVRNAQPRAVALSVRNVMGRQAEISESENAIVVRAPQPVIDIVEAVVAQLDVASVRANVEITVQLLYGSAAADQGGPIPAELQPIVEQLQSLFSYKSYRLQDSLLLRGGDGRDIEASGLLPSGNTDLNQPTIYQLRFQPHVTANGDAPRILLQNLRFSARVPIVTGTTRSESGTVNSQFQYIDSGINTDLELREGQRTVVGKSSVGTEDAMILVVSAKVVE